MHASFAALLAVFLATGAIAGGNWGGWDNKDDNKDNNKDNNGNWGGWGNKDGHNDDNNNNNNNNNWGWNPPPPGPPPPPSPFPPAPPFPPPPGPPSLQWQKPVQLHPNGNWRKCLDVRGSWFQPGTRFLPHSFDCNGSPGQNWVLNPGSTKVQVAGQDFCLDAGEWPNDGTQLKIWNCYDNIPAQQWWYTDDKRLSLKDTGKCLDLTNGETCNGNIVQLWQCLNFDTNQILESRIGFDGRFGEL